MSSEIFYKYRYLLFFIKYLMFIVCIIQIIIIWFRFAYKELNLRTK